MTTIIKNKKKFQKEAHARYQNLSEEEKEKNHQYHCERNNLPEEKKQKQIGYMRNYSLAQKK